MYVDNTSPHLYCCMKHKFLDGKENARIVIFFHTCPCKALLGRKVLGSYSAIIRPSNRPFPFDHLNAKVFNPFCL